MDVGCAGTQAQILALLKRKGIAESHRNSGGCGGRKQRWEESQGSTQSLGTIDGEPKEFLLLPSFYPPANSPSKRSSAALNGSSAYGPKSRGADGKSSLVRVVRESVIGFLPSY